MNRITILFIMLGWLVLGSASAIPSVDEIVQRAHHSAYYLARDGRATITMQISDSQQRLRQRQFTLLRRNQADTTSSNSPLGEQHYYVHFSHPADIRNTVFMVWKQPHQDDDRWLYLPALDLVRRIAAADKRTSFVGSDFFYEDLSGRHPQADQHERIGTDADYYVIRYTPRKPQAVEFSHYIVHVHKDTFLPIQAEYFDHSGKLYRIYNALQVSTIQGYPTVTKARMRDLRRGSETSVELTQVVYDIGLPESLFSERYLRQLPTRYLR